MHVYNFNILRAWQHISLRDISLSYRPITRIFASAADRLNKGVKRELNFAAKYFSKSTHVRTLTHLFQQALSCIPFFPRSDQKILQGFDLLEDEIAVDNALMDFEIKSLSKLKKERSESEHPVSRETLLSFYGPRKKESPDIQSLFSFLGSFAQKNLGSNPFSPVYQKGFSKGLERKENLKQWIGKNEIISEKEQNEGLSKKASKLSKEIRNLEPGQSFIYFGELPTKASATLSFLDDHFQKFLPEDLYLLMQGNNKELSIRLKSYVLENLKKNELLNAESNKTQIEEKLSEICNQTKETICKLLPESWYDGIASSLKIDVEELLLGSKKEDRSQVAEELWNKMVDKGFLQAIDMAIDQSLSSTQCLIQKSLDTIKENVASKIPKTVLDLLSVCGVELNPNESFSLEIKREENDNDENKKFCVTFYSNSLGSVIHPTVVLEDKQGSHLPLVFRNVDAKRLNEIFCGMLVSYEARPQWESGVSYSLSNVCEEILGLLKTAPEKPESSTTYPVSSFFSGQPLDWLKLHLHHQTDSESKDFEKCINYDLPYQLLINFWPEVMQKPELLTQNSVRTALESMVNGLSEKGVELYQKEELTLEEVKSLYATLKMVKKALGIHETKIPLGNKELSVIIPHQLQATIKEMAQKLSLAPTHYELIKQAFLEIVGDDVEEDIDQILQQILPELAEKQGIVLPESEVSWEEIFKLEPVKQFVTEAIPSRVSLLHAYRIYAKISSVLMYALGFTTRIYFIGHFIQLICPQIVKYTPYTAKAIATLLAYFGPSLFKRMLPKKLLVTLSALLGLVEEMMGYVLKRVGLHILRVVMRRLLTPESVNLLKSSIKRVPPQLFREGEISYDLPDNLPPRQLIVKSPSEEENAPKIDLKPVDDSKSDEVDILVDELLQEESKQKEQVKKNRSQIPRPNKAKITSENICFFLDKLSYDTIHIGRTMERQSLVYFNAQIRLLPLPGEKGGELWDNVKNPQALIKDFYRKVSFLAQLDITNSADESAELITSVYSIYVIMDKLVRRCPEAYLNNDFKANGVNLARWMRNPVLKISHRKTYEKLKLVAQYLDLEPFKKYTDEELNDYQKGRLFDYDRGNFWKRPSVTSNIGFFGDSYCNRDFYLNMGSFKNSHEASYYQELLQKKEIREKLEILGVDKNTPQQYQLALLFQNLSLEDLFNRYLKLENLFEEEKKQFELLKRKIEENTEKKEEFSSLLPLPFHHLRLVHLMCSGFDRELTYRIKREPEIVMDHFPHEVEQRKKLGVCLTPKPKKGDDFFERLLGPLAVSTIDTVVSYVENKLDLVTNDYLIKYSFESNLEFSEFKQDIQWDIVKRGGAYGRGGDPLFPGHTIKLGDDYSWLPLNGVFKYLGIIDDGNKSSLPSYYKFIEKPSKRSQSEIIIDADNIQSKNFPKELLNILEMVNTHKADQLIRALSLMVDSENLLTQPEFRSLFELLVTELEAVDTQLMQEAEVVQTLGCFFNSMLKHFYKNQDFPTCLYLTKVGSYLLQHCKRHDSEASKYFPDFSDFIEKKIVPAYRKLDRSDRSFKYIEDGLILSYYYLVASYYHLDPSDINESQKNDVIKAIARLQYSLINNSKYSGWFQRLDVGVKLSEMIYRWGAHVDKVMSDDSKLRNEILHDILADSGIDANKIAGEWQGEFPNLRKGEFSIHCTSEREDSTFERLLKQDIKQQFGVKLTHGLQTSSNIISFPHEGWEITFRKAFSDRDRLDIRINVEGKKWRYLKPDNLTEEKICLPQGDNLFLEENSENPTILQMRAGQVVARHTMHRGKDPFSFELCESKGEIEQKLLPEQRGDGLVALNWFQPPSATEMSYSPTSLGPELKKIKFTKLDLAFEIQSVNGVKQAVCSDQKTPGFYIAKKQGDNRLKAYSNYLLLENEGQDKQVHLIPKPLKEILGISLLKGIVGVNTTPLIESMMKSSLDGKKFYTYRLNEKGKLESSDPEALFYLAIFHWARGDFREGFDYLTMLQDAGRQAPFSKEVIQLMDYLTTPLLISRAPEAEEMLLRLTAIREENLSLHNLKLNSFSQEQMIRWITLQMKYSSYLQKIENGTYPYLDHHQEVLIIRSLVALNSLAIKCGIQKMGTKLHNIFDRLGVGSIIERCVMLPAIKKRYRELRKLDEDAISWGAEAEELLFETFFGKGKPSIPTGISINVVDTVKSIAKKVPGLSEAFGVEPKENGVIPALIAFFKQGKEYAFKPNQPIKKEMFSEYDPENISTRLFDLTPTAIKKNFFYFYRLAMQQMPKGWVEKEEQERFVKQAKEFRRNFPLLKGKFEDPVVNQMMAILQMVFEKGTKDQFPEPDILEKLFSSDKKGFEETITKLLDEASSWNRWVAKVLRPFKVQSHKSIGQTARKVEVSFLSHLVDSILTSSFSFYSRGLSLGISAVHSFYALRKEHDEIREKIVKRDENIFEQNSRTKSLPMEFEESMTQRESAIDQVMKGIFDEYFEIPETSEIAYQECIIDGKVDLSLYSEFPDLQKSLNDYYDRASSGKDVVQLKKGKDFKSLWNKLVRLRNEVDQVLTKERQYIKGFIRSKLLANQDIISKMKGEQVPEVPFKEIDNLFIQEKDHELIERFKIPQEKLPHLKQRLYLYHVMASRWNLLFEKMAELKDPTSKAVPMIAEELQRKRVYGFKDVPERLVRGKVVFESRTGKMLWDKQSSQIDRMLLNQQDRQVVELIMGSGKSWYGIPEISYFSGFVINIWPAAVAKTNIAGIFRQARKIFNQAATALQINRKIKWVKDNSWSLYQIFQRAFYQREQINMTKEDLQSSELCYIEKGIAFAKNRARELKEVGENFWKVLKRVRYDSKGCIDEAHKQFDRRKELNYPLGKKKRLDVKYIEVMTNALYELVSDKEFSEILTLKSEKPSPLSEEDYKDKIQGKLAEKLAASFDFKDQELKDVALYLSGQAEAIPKCVLENEKNQEIALVKGLLTVFIPEALQRTIHVDFNPSKKGLGEYVRPSEGNDNPLEEAIIQSPFEAYVKTAFQLLHDRLKDQQIEKLVDYLQKKARDGAGGGNPNATLEAIFFKEQCPGYELFSFGEKDRPEIYKMLRNSDQATLLYLKNFIAKDILYTERRLSSNSSNFGSMFTKFYSDTGTPYNKGSYLPGTEVLEDKGTDGEAIHMMSRQSESTRILKDEAPKKVLEELIGFMHEDKMIRALIDRGAVLNGISSDEVAKRLLEYITKERPEMKGIAFYRDGELMVLEKGALKAIPVHLSKISEDERLTYFPEPQTYAADVPQVKGAKGLITVAPTTCSNEWFQAGYRMRGLGKKNQKLIPVMTERTRKTIVQDSSIPDMHEINLFTKRNEERQQKEDNYQADRQKMHDVVRRAILDKSLEAKTFDEAAAILAHFEDFLISKVEDDPFNLFGHIDTQVKPEEVFELLRKRYEKMIEEEKIFTSQDKERIKRDLKPIGYGKYPDTVHSYKVEGQLEVDKLDDINKQAQMHSDDHEEVEQETQVQNEQQVEQLQNEQEIQVKAQEFYTWPEKIIPTALDWLNELAVDLKNTEPTISGLSGFFKAKNQVSLYSLAQLLQSSEMKESQAIAGQISPRILISRNMLYEDPQRPLEAFGPYQVPVFEVLVIKKGNEKPCFVVINQDEADFWRKKLEEDRLGKYKYDSDPSVKIGLCNVSTKSFVKQGKNRFDKLDVEEQLFKGIMVQLKFLRGDVGYDKEQRKILKSWLQNNPKAMNFFHTVHRHHAISPIEGSELNRILIEIDPKREKSWIKI